MWNKVLREYFAYSRKERRGLLVLFVVWLILLLYQLYKYEYDFSFYTPNTYRISYMDEVHKYDSIVYNRTSKKTYNNLKIYPKYFSYTTQQDFEKFGLNKKQIAKLLALKNAGLKIYSQNDLLQNKDIDSPMALILLKHLKFFQEKKYFKPYEVKQIVNVVFDLNLADTTQLDQVRGISKGLAKRIISYRERLGGFIRKEQLQEVWGMDSASYITLASKTQINISQIKPININTAEVNVLGKHPYIGYALAKIIVNYRAQHGPYQKVEDLLKIHVMNEDIFSKIESYIRINEH